MTVTDLACARGPAQVLAGVNFSLAPGEALILRGPNGSGKTTLLRTLAGLTPPIAGRIEMAEDAIAYAGHADGLKAQLTVAENLTFWARVFGADDIGPATRQPSTCRAGRKARGRHVGGAAAAPVAGAASGHRAARLVPG
jgi:heme exporter protein A